MSTTERTALLAEIRETAAANRPHNLRLFAEAGAPAGARRGLHAATSGHMDRVESVERIGSRFLVTTGTGPYSTRRYSIGPRGAHRAL